MSKICIAIGFADASPRAKPELVYLGRSGEEMRQAVESSTCPRLLLIPHASGIPKGNPRAAANAAAQRARSVAEPLQPGPVTRDLTITPPPEKKSKK